jgi:hypothetical protein
MYRTIPRHESTEPHIVIEMTVAEARELLKEHNLIASLETDRRSWPSLSRLAYLILGAVALPANGVERFAVSNEIHAGHIERALPSHEASDAATV